MRAEIYSVANLKSGTLSIMAHPRGWDWLEDEIKALQTMQVDVLVSLVTSQEVRELGLLEEQALCKFNNIEYQNLPIPDRNVLPLNKATIDFIRQLFVALNQGNHIAIHCRAGIGRSALVAASEWFWQAFRVMMLSTLWKLHGVVRFPILRNNVNGLLILEK